MIWMPKFDIFRFLKREDIHNHMRYSIPKKYKRLIKTTKKGNEHGEIKNRL